MGVGCGDVERVSVRKRGSRRIIVRSLAPECQEIQRVACVTLGSTRQPALAPLHSVRQDEESGDAAARLSLPEQQVMGRPSAG